MDVVFGDDEEFSSAIEHLGTGSDKNVPGCSSTDEERDESEDTMILVDVAVKKAA